MVLKIKGYRARIALLVPYLPGVKAAFPAVLHGSPSQTRFDGWRGKMEREKQLPGRSKNEWNNANGGA